MKGPGITVEVVLALPERQTLRRVRLPTGSNVEDALVASGLAQGFRSIASARVGIYGKGVPVRTALRDGDRVEIYRPLRADPKDVRRVRAAKKRAKP
ncbi:MAG TPA: RnfH family protein [Burkholderiales bacterium]|jgi:putative ubiquitin-RnfH superfamily antitoxin RatB of RatAB toxin-antitoxin module|nr:RnfH family protein [Burkholderiales bacterium]